MFALMVVAMGALGALFVASASAETPGEFLANGVLFETALPATLEGELLFENLKTPSARFLCSGIFDGELVNEATGGLYLVNKALELTTGVEVTESDTVAKLACVPDEGSICSKAAVSPVGLPWDADLELVTETDYVLVTLANANGVLPGYFLLCEVLGLDNTELCTVLAGTTQLVENDATHVFFPAGSSPSADAECSKDAAGEENGGLFVDEALLSLDSGETLAASL